MTFLKCSNLLSKRQYDTKETKQATNKQYFIGKNSCLHDCEKDGPDIPKDMALGASLSPLDLPAYD